MKIRGGPRRTAQGFTVIEVLIVLAVVTGMFFMAAALIGGQQAKTDFNVGSRLLRTQIQTVMNEAASGYYPSNGNLKCTKGWRPFFANDNAVPIVTQDVSASSTQGTNSDCMFLGNVIVFNPDSRTPVLHISDYKLYPVVGFRQGGFTGGDITSLFDASPEVVAPPNWVPTIRPRTVTEPNPPQMTIPDASRTIKLPNGLKYAGIKASVESNSGPVAVLAGATSSDRPIGIFVANSFSSQFFNGDSAQGSKLQELRWTSNTNYPTSGGEKALANWIDDEWLVDGLNGISRITNPALPDTLTFPKIYDMDLCFISGGTNQSVALSFKASSSEPSYQIYDGLKCGGIVP